MTHTNPPIEVNRGAITLSPNADDSWVRGLMASSADLDQLHFCDVTQNHDGSWLITFCDGESCPNTNAEIGEDDPE